MAPTSTPKEKWLGPTALMWAVAENHPAVVEMLIAQRCRRKRPIPLSERKRSRTSGSRRMLYRRRPKAPYAPTLCRAAKLARSGPDAGEGGCGSEHRRSRRNQRASDRDRQRALRSPDYLLEQGADPNIADKFGRTALYAAVDMHTLEKSATRPDPKETDKATSLDVVKAALAHGANPNAALKESAPGRGSLDVPDRYLGLGATPPSCGRRRPAMRK